ncbi:MAG TPA: hypothetical protein DEG43_17205 [Acidimicrobiaceae bacterium]|nr:hypothetical protein [Acidimicrobiaceae bacterium]
MAEDAVVQMQFTTVERTQVFNAMNPARNRWPQIFLLTGLAVGTAAYWDRSLMGLAASILLGAGSMWLGVAVAKYRAKRSGHDQAVAWVSESGIGSQARGQTLFCEWHSVVGWRRTDEVLAVYISETHAIPLLRSQLGPELEAQVMSTLSAQGIEERQPDRRPGWKAVVIAFLGIWALVGVLVVIMVQFEGERDFGKCQGEPSEWGSLEDRMTQTSPSTFWIEC